eukprot:354989-Amorphochlora_amoeboformis.AAC.1
MKVFRFYGNDSVTLSMVTVSMVVTVCATFNSIFLTKSRCSGNGKVTHQVGVIVTVVVTCLHDRSLTIQDMNQDAAYR